MHAPQFVELYERAFSRALSVSDLERLLDHLLAAGLTSEAAAAAGEVADIQPENPDLKRTYGVALGDAGQRELAAIVLRQAVELDALNPVAHYNLIKPVCP